MTQSVFEYVTHFFEAKFIFNQYFNISIKLHNLYNYAHFKVYIFTLCFSLLFKYLSKNMINLSTFLEKVAKPCKRN